MRRAILALLPLLGTSLAAQQHSLVGTWQITYPAGMRIENGTPTTIMATGVLTVAAAGDSLIANLVSDPLPDAPARPPARLAAASGTGPITFISRTKATLNLNGEAREATAISTWVLGATGDTLEGTVERQIEGMAMGSQPPKPVKGTRKSGTGM